MTKEELEFIDNLLAEITAKGEMVFILAKARDILRREIDNKNKGDKPSETKSEGKR